MSTEHDTIEAVAHAVHDAWLEAARWTGWTYGDELDSEGKRHPGLRPYDELPADEKRRRRTQAEHVIAILEGDGWTLSRHEEAGAVDVCKNDEGVKVRSAVSVSDETRALNTRLAISNFEAGRFDDAYEYARNADDGNAAIQYFLGNASRDDGDTKRAAELFRKSADQGYADAMADLAWLHIDGAGVAQDYAAAVDLMKKSADLGCPFGLNGMGCIYLRGLIDGRPDEQKAFECFTLAAEKGCPPAWTNLGDMYRDGMSVSPDSSKMLDCYMKADKLGNADGMMAAARCYEFGIGTRVDLPKALELYERADCSGSRDDAEEACRRVRRKVQEEHVGGEDSATDAFAVSDAAKQTNTELAIRSYREGRYDLVYGYASRADRENPVVQCLLGRSYHSGVGVARDDAKAVECFRAAIDLGDSESCEELALMYGSGEGVIQDYTMKMTLLRQGVERGSLSALRALGYMYYSGEGVERNFIEAARAYERAADGGDIYAMENLGWMLLCGEGVAKDIKRAKNLLEEAASKGNVYAQADLGDLYCFGRHGAVVSYHRAMEYYRKAANSDYAYAQRMLGYMYECGMGVLSDAGKAAEWYGRATANDDAVSRRRLEALRKTGWRLSSGARDIPYGVFISYRRDGGLQYARNLAQALINRGYKVFFDFSSIHDGKFDDSIREGISQAKNFILLVTDGAFDRCMDASDWIRQEIECALANHKKIVPVCPDGHKRNFPVFLPESIRAIAREQISRLADDDMFDMTVDAIVSDRFVKE